MRCVRLHRTHPKDMGNRVSQTSTVERGDMKLVESMSLQSTDPVPLHPLMICGVGLA